MIILNNHNIQTCSAELLSRFQCTYDATGSAILLFAIAYFVAAVTPPFSSVRPIFGCRKKHPRRIQVATDSIIKNSGIL